MISLVGFSPGVDEPMGTLGERLRREREAKGISLADIANDTRIGARLLEAIEKEQFEQLPGGIYNKAFLRQYASYLGLDQDEIMREYELATKVAEETVTPQETPLPEAPPVRAASVVLPWKLAALALIPIVVAVLWLLFRAPDSGESSSSGTDSALPEPEPEPVQTRPVGPVATRPPAPAPQPTPAPMPSQQPQADQQKTNVAAAPAEPVPSPPPAAPVSAPTPSVPDNQLRLSAMETSLADASVTELRLEINARSEVWLYITADGDQVWQGILQPNQTHQVQAEESIRLTVGNAGGVELMLNGKPLGELGRLGEVKRVSIATNAMPSVTP